MLLVKFKKWNASQVSKNQKKHLTIILKILEHVHA